MIVCQPAPDPMCIAEPDAVTVKAPGRLHLGFLDPAGSLGRAFGSLGLVIDGYETAVMLGSAHHDVVSADTPAGQAQIDRAGRCLGLLRQRSGRREALHLRLCQVPPAHAGFGSGTQLALAIGHAFARWHGLDLGSAMLAHWLGRGARSGIGIAGFDQGGLLLDGGPCVSGAPAPLLARVALPEAWRVVVVEDRALHGLSGDNETRALADLQPLPRALAADICHQVLMRVLPGAACADFAPFAAGVSQVQQVLGQHFAPAQGGALYASAAVGKLMHWLAEASRAGADHQDREAAPGAAIGQSSWGPTGFAILPSQSRAEALVDAARAAGQIGPDLNVRTVRACNQGATITDSRTDSRTG